MKKIILVSFFAVGFFFLSRSSFGMGSIEISVVKYNCGVLKLRDLRIKCSPIRPLTEFDSWQIRQHKRLGDLRVKIRGNVGFDNLLGLLEEIGFSIVHLSITGFHRFKLELLEWLPNLCFFRSKNCFIPWERLGCLVKELLVGKSLKKLSKKLPPRVLNLRVRDFLGMEFGLLLPEMGEEVLSAFLSELHNNVEYFGEYCRRIEFEGVKFKFGVVLEYFNRLKLRKVGIEVEGCRVERLAPRPTARGRRRRCGSSRTRLLFGDEDVSDDFVVAEISMGAEE